MAQLVVPTDVVQESFRAAMAEFAEEGRTGDRSMIGGDLQAFGSRWHTPEGFAEYLAHLRADADPATPRRNGWVVCSTWWWVEGREFLGRIALRHELTDGLRINGGHIGYDVRRSARRRGHAVAMLRAVLPKARALGITSALITCDITNTASRKVIEACSGTLQDSDGGMHRFWVPTA